MAATRSPGTGSPTRPVIGIEIHVQLRTASKMFCGCSNDISEAAPNANTCPVCLGLPGALPVINREAVRHVLATGIAHRGHHARGHPLGPQELLLPGPAQGLPDQPVRAAAGLRRPARGGDLAGHGGGGHHPRSPRGGHGAAAAHAARRVVPVSLLDYDRSGAPLLEIVTDPVIHDAETARRYAEELRLLLLTIGASHAAMESGQMRVEANVSLRAVGTEAFGTRVEVKNMNSFRSVERAIEYEIVRQEAALRAGEPLRPGDPRLGRRTRRDLPHAHQGDVGRLPLLPRARPAAAARGPGLAGRDPRRAARAAGRAPSRATATSWASPPTTPTCW